MKKNMLELTTNEANILIRLLEGRAARFICQEKNIAESTFRVHIRNIKAKIFASWREIEPEKGLKPSKHQLLVLNLRAQGKSHCEIAKQLGMSPLTSQKHTAVGLKRLGLSPGQGGGWNRLPLQQALAKLAAQSKPIELDDF